MRKVLFLSFLLFLIGCGGAKKEEAKNKEISRLKGKKVLMVIAHHDFRDEEYQRPRHIFEKVEMKVTVASSDTLPAKGMLGLEVKPDILLSQAKVEDYDCLVFVGGRGAQEYWDNPLAHKLLQEAVNQGKIIGAICIAPVTLARAGILKGKKATVWSSSSEDLKSGGAIYTGAQVEVDGKIVTGNGPDAAKPFGKAIVQMMLGK